MRFWFLACGSCGSVRLWGRRLTLIAKTIELISHARSRLTLTTDTKVPRSSVT